MSTEIPLPAPTRAENIAEMLRIALEWQGYVAPMVWGLCEAPKGEAFITSDNPVHMVDDGANGYEDYQGPTAGLRFGYPLSPRFMLTGAYVPAYDQALKVDKAWVAQANQAQVYRALQEIYASFRSPALKEQVDRVHATRKAVIPEFPLAPR